MTSDEARERMPRHQGADPARLARDSAPVREARRLARQSLKGALATLEAGTGYPYASLVIVATDPAGHPLLLLSALTSLDPEGVDLRSAERTARAVFLQPAATPAAVRGSVQSLA